MRFSIIIPVLIFNNLMGITQSSTAQPAALKNYQALIDTWVSTVQRDSTLLILQTPSLKSGLKKKGHPMEVLSGWKGNELRWMQWNSGNWIDRSTVYRIYFQNNNPVLLVEQHFNQTRMGSCGAVEVTMKHYLKAGKPAAGRLLCNTLLYNCYGYQLSRPDMRLLQEQVDRFRLLLLVKGKPVKKYVRGLPFQFFIPGIAETGSQWESYGF